MKLAKRGQGTGRPLGMPCASGGFRRRQGETLSRCRRHASTACGGAGARGACTHFVGKGCIQGDTCLLAFGMFVFFGDMLCFLGGVFFF